MPKRPKDALRPLLRRKPLLIGVGVVVLLVAGAITAYALGHRSADDTSASEQRTVAIEEGSLASSFTLSGYLGYGDAESLSGATGGIVTKVPEAGQMISAGQVIMEVEGAPVFLLQGDLPLWRDIKPGVTGIDVQNLRDSLAKLGIDAGSGQTYDSTLSQAIATLYSNAGYSEPVVTADDKTVQDQAKQALDQAKQALSDAQQQLTAAQNATASEADLDQAWTQYQQALGVANACTDTTSATCQQAQTAASQALAAFNQLNSPPDTSAQQSAVTQAQTAVNQAQETYDEAMENSVGPDNILIVPEDKIRVDEVSATVGQAIQGPVLTWTKTVLYGQATLTDTQARQIATGTQATLEWSDGSSVQGTVGQITEAKMDTTTGQETPPSVRIDVTDQATLAQHGPSAVTISFIQDEADDALIVPVTALVVPAEGGYCVEKADGTYVRVELGLISDTRVQIFSDDLHKGDLVVVP